MSKGKNTTPAKGDAGWQAQKSAMTRDGILDAAIDCFIELGYANTTTARIAERSGVSRGAMLHHFPSKNGLIQAAVEHLHGKLVELYRANVRRIPEDLSVDERNRRGLQAYWKYLSSDLFTAYHELSVAGRTDPELQQILQSSSQDFVTAWHDANNQLFPDWTDRGELYELAMDVTQFLMEGMAVTQVVRHRDKRIKRVLNYLGDRLEEIFHEGDADAAINRHAQK